MSEEIDRDGTVIMLRHKLKLANYDLRKAHDRIKSLEWEVKVLENSNHNLWMRVNDEMEKEGQQNGST